MITNRRRLMGNGVVEEYLIFKDIDIWTICCCNWGDYEEVVITDNGDNTVNIATTPVHMKNTTSKRGTTTTEYNVDNTGGIYTAGTTKVPIGIKRSQCLAVTGIKGGILKLVDCRLFSVTRSYDKTKEIYGFKMFRSDAQKVDCYAIFTIDADNDMRYYFYYQRFGYINGVNSYEQIPNQFGYAIDSDAYLCLFGQSTFAKVNGIGTFKSIAGYRPNLYTNAKYFVISEDSDALPYDAQVEYLQSSGTQYIELPYKPNQDTSMEIVVSVASDNGTADTYIFGVQAGNANRRYILRNNASSNQLAAAFGDAGSVTKIDNQMVVETNYKIKYEKNEVYINDVAVKTLTNYTFQCEYYLVLFGWNKAGSITAATGSPQIHSMKIWDGSTLAMDLIPVRKGQVGYMYDRLTNRMWGNVGTDNFIVGNDIVEIEYLENTGTQYIDPLVYSSETGRMSGKVLLQRYPSGGIAIIGNGGTNGQVLYSVRFQNGQNIRAYTKNGNYSAGITSDYNTHEFDLDMKSKVFTLDNTSVNVEASSEGNIYKLFVFAYSRTGQVDNGYSFIGKIYRFKFYDNDVLLRDFIPVRVGTTGYMYDKVSGRLYGNAGTGDFILGPDL